LKNKIDRYFIAGLFALALVAGGCAAKDVDVRTQGDSVRGRNQGSTDSGSGTSTESGTRRSGSGTTSGSGSFSGSGSGSVTGSGSGTSRQAE